MSDVKSMSEGKMSLSLERPAIQNTRCTEEFKATRALETQSKKLCGDQPESRLRTLILIMMMTLFGFGSQSLAQTTPVEGAAGSSVVTTVPTSRGLMNKVSLIWINETGTSIDRTRTQGGGDTFNAIIMNYKYSPDWSFGVTQAGEYSFGTLDKDGTPTQPNWRDLAVTAGTSYSNVLGSEKLPVVYMVMLPTTQDSRDADQPFGLGAEISLSYGLAKSLDANVLVQPRWYVRAGNSDQLGNAITGEIRYSHTKAFSSYGYVSHSLRMAADTNLSKSKEVASVGMGVGYSPHKVIDLDFHVSRDRHVFEPTAKNESVEFTFLDPKEINYAAMAVLKF